MQEETFSRAIVTGGAGFIGSHIVDYLHSNKIEVTVIDNVSTGVSQNIRQLLDEGVEFVNASVTNYDMIKPCFKGVDVVFHFASVVGVKLATRQPLKVLNENIAGIKNVLEASRKGRVKKVILASSSEVYGDTLIVPMREDFSVSPISPYGLTKIVGEEYCKAYNKKYRLQTSIVRYFNVYGPRQSWRDRSWVIPSFCMNILEGRPLIIHGRGDQTRDFTYISDAVRGTYLVALKGLGNGDIYNIGAGKETSIRELASLMIEISGRKVGVLHVKPRTFRVSRRCASIDKVRRLGYTPEVSLTDGLMTTFRYYAEQRRQLGE